MDIRPTTPERIAALCFFFFGALVVLGIVCWQIYQAEPIYRTQVRIVSNWSLSLPIQPRVSDQYLLVLLARYDHDLIVAALDDRDSVLGIGWRRAIAADSIVRTAVDLAWSVEFGGRRVAGGVARGRDAGLVGRESERILGSFRASALKHYVVKLHVRSGSPQLDSLAPHLEIHRPWGTEEGNLVLWLYAMFGALLAGIGVLGYLGSLWLARRPNCA